MILLIITIVVSIIWGVSVAKSGYVSSISDYLMYPFMFCIFLLFIWGIVQVAGNSLKSVEVSQTYALPIVSLNDGTGIKGSIYGSMFVMRGSVDDTQLFSYYRKNDNGSYAFEKHDANQSTIWMDATPESAHVDITDRVTSSCKSEWWLICPPYISRTFEHADFHIPPGSIQEEYNLDAK